MSSGFNRDDIKGFMRKVYSSQEIADTMVSGEDWKEKITDEDKHQNNHRGYGHVCNRLAQVCG